MQPTKALEILVQATAHVQANRETHQILLEALETLRRHLTQSELREHEIHQEHSNEDSQLT